MFDIKAELKKLPDKPGVYLMKHDDIIIYVGKAVILKNRVRQYFQKNNKSARIEKMVSLITSFEYIVTDSEVEALMLECNLIKLHRPKFNVMLKDDKTYPYIKITNETFPQIFITRRLQNDGAQYFGPYMDVTIVKEGLEYIKNIYKIRSCRIHSSKLSRKDRPCINYQIGKCNAPCTNQITHEEYMNNINEIAKILSGDISKLIKNLQVQMQEYSSNLEYEKAGKIRDRIANIKGLIQKQKVSNFNENDIDVIGIYRNKKVCLQIFYVRNHKLIGRDNYFFSDIEDMSDEELVLSFMKQYYTATNEIPSKIMVRYEIDDDGLREFLTNKKGSKVEIRTPKIGEKIRFIEMAENNAKISLENTEKDANVNINIMSKIQEILKLESNPTRIESYDISNLSGTNIVGGMIVIEDGVFKKNRYRKFKIKDMYDQDDPKCMAQVLDRRLNEAINKKNESFLPLPDLILLDGGITQLNAVHTVLEKYDLHIPVYGMFKDDKHRTKGLLSLSKQHIGINDDEVFKYITNVQDEVHRYAIAYHKNLRDKNIVKSKLDGINGIGKKRKEELLKRFGSVEKISRCTIEELMQINGITEKIAMEILYELKEEYNEKK